MDRGRGPANNSPTLIADPNDARFVVLANRLDAPDFGCALHVSGDGGRSWSPAAPVPKLPKGAEKCYAPEVAIDGAGRLYYLFVGLAGNGNEPMGVFLTSSPDRGRSFSAPQRVLGAFNFAVRMAIDPSLGKSGRIHLVWLHATSDPPFGGFGPPPNPILASHSDNGGRSFSEPVQVSDPRRQRVVAPALALGDDHAVHVAYYDLRDDALDYQGLEGPVHEEPWSLVVATSRDGGRRFGRGSEAEPRVTPPPERVMLIFTMPPPALVARKGLTCLAWTDGRHGDHDVLARCARDPDGAWGPVRRLHDDKVGNGHTQYLPRLSFSPNGRLDAIFYDRRNDPRNTGNDLYYTYSDDGGRRFVPNVRLTSETSLSLIGQRYANATAKGQVEFGGRLGLLSRRQGAVAAWADTRSSLVNTTGQDVMSALVRLGNGSGRSGPNVLVWTLVVAGGAIGAIGARRGLARLVGAARRRPGVVVFAVFGAAATALAGFVITGHGAQRRTTYLPKGAPVVTVRMTEYRFDHNREVPAGRVVFKFANEGNSTHRPSLVPLAEDLPPLAEQLRGSARRAVQPFAGLYNRPPGAEGSFAVDLEPGRRYGLICYAQEEDGSSHALKGMSSEFRAGGPSRSGSGPAPSTSTG